MQGEHRVARSRLVLVGSLTVVSAIVLVREPGNFEFWRGLPISIACTVVAFGVFLATRSGTSSPNFAAATSIGDVSLVSFLHVMALLQEAPSAAVNGRVIFPLYFVALVGTCVRFDGRLPIVAGATAVLQYAGVVWWSQSVWPTTPTRDVEVYGAFDVGVQLQRMATLAIFAYICTNIATWALQLRTSATRDELTGLTNRRAFEERLQTELLLSSRREEPLSVAMLDVDHFKRVNDQHGHHAGDEALRAVAALIRQTVRRTDLAARWGGEEFAIAFPAVSTADAALSVERLRAQLESTIIPLPAAQTTQLTISAGLASSPRDGADVVSLVRAADSRLLNAKRAGRNRLVADARY